MTEELIEIASTNDIPIGRVKAFTVDGRRVAVYHTARGFFASENQCPHRGGPLAEGDLIGNEIICPWHLWGFDIESGVCTGEPSTRIATYGVVIENERILIRLSAERETSSLP